MMEIGASENCQRGNPSLFSEPKKVWVPLYSCPLRVRFSLANELTNQPTDSTISATERRRTDQTLRSYVRESTCDHFFSRTYANQTLLSVVPRKMIS